VITYQKLETNQQLVALCDRLATCEAVALDTEFMRVNTYYPQIGLLQVFADGQIYLLDPLTIDCWQPFKALLQAPRPQKVLHACSEDLEVFQYWLGVRPQALVDTQVAAAFAGLGYTLGYQNMLLQLLGLHIDKDETRSNWLQRPLSQAQYRYAALDVCDLLTCYRQLQQRLQDQGRWDWFQSDMRRLSEPVNRLEPQQAYRQVKSAWRITGQSLGVLQALAAWRESKARQWNRPRGFLLSDAAMLALAEARPNHFRQLAQHKQLSTGSVSRYGQSWLQAIAKGKLQTPVSLPEPLGKAEYNQFKRLQHCARNVAKQVRLEPQLLFRKRDLLVLFEGLRQHKPINMPSAWNGWRWQLLQVPITQIYNQLLQEHTACET
jgi:ribonuclease D